MQAYVTACELMDLHARSWICMHSGTFWNILHAFWNILELSGTFCMHSGTFWNFLHAFWNILEHSTCTLWKNFNLSTDGHTDIRTCWAASSQLKRVFFNSWSQRGATEPPFFTKEPSSCCQNESVWQGRMYQLIYIETTQLNKSALGNLAI